MSGVAERRSVVILASKDDVHADAVVHECQLRGSEVFRFDPSALTGSLMSGGLMLTMDSQDARLVFMGRTLRLSQVQNVLCRAWFIPDDEHDEQLPQKVKRHECHAALVGFFSCIPASAWLNPPWVEQQVEHKVVQSLAAKAAGFRVPRSLVTNDPASFREFWNSCNGDVVIKQLSEISMVDCDNVGPAHYGFFTVKITDDQLAHIDEIRNSPCHFQERIEKCADIRAVVIDDVVVAYSINSQDQEVSRTDFRRYPTARFSATELPRAISAALVSLNRTLGLRFSACDLALTNEGNYVFFEANPSGNWLWLETPSHHPALDALANALSDFGVEKVEAFEMAK